MMHEESLCYITKACFNVLYCIQIGGHIHFKSPFKQGVNSKKNCTAKSREILAVIFQDWMWQILWLALQYCIWHFRCFWDTEPPITASCNWDILCVKTHLWKQAKCTNAHWKIPGSPEVKSYQKLKFKTKAVELDK